MEAQEDFGGVIYVYLELVLQTFRTFSKDCFWGLYLLGVRPAGLDCLAFCEDHRTQPLCDSLPLLSVARRLKDAISTSNLLHENNLPASSSKSRRYLSWSRLFVVGGIVSISL